MVGPPSWATGSAAGRVDSGQSMTITAPTTQIGGRPSCSRSGFAAPHQLGLRPAEAGTTSAGPAKEGSSPTGVCGDADLGTGLWSRTRVAHANPVNRSLGYQDRRRSGRDREPERRVKVKR